MSAEGTWCTWAGGKCAHNNKPTCAAQPVKKCALLRDQYRAEAKEKRDAEKAETAG